MATKHRVIDFLNMPAFMVEVERVQDPRLRDRPIVIAPLKSDAAKIWEVSNEAREQGVFKGMELAVAKRVYRGIEVLNPNPDLYQAIHRKILFKASRYTPVFEDAGLGKMYLDFTGFNQLYGNPLDFGQKLSKDIAHEFSLPLRLGIAQNKLVSKAATNMRFERERVFEVAAKGLVDFLDPFPNSTLPVIKEFQKKNQHPLFDVFEDLNLLTVKNLKDLDLVTLAAIFPGIANSIHDMSRGIDLRPVSPALNEPVVAMDIHLEETNDQTLILNTMYGLADQVFNKLREQGQNSCEFKLAIRYSDFKYLEKSVSLPLPVNYSHEVYALLKRSMEFLFSRRTTMRYMMLELKGLSTVAVQLDLFADNKKAIFDAMDEINKKFPAKLLRGHIPQGER
jgi:DNA polymerase-4